MQRDQDAGDALARQAAMQRQHDAQRLRLLEEQEKMRNSAEQKEQKEEEEEERRGLQEEIDRRDAAHRLELGNAQERQARASADYEGSVLSALDYCLP